MAWRKTLANAERIKRYADYNAYLRNLFGERVQKISVDAGLTCPNRDGTLSRAGCIYCNAKGSGTGAFAKGLSIAQQIEAGKIGAMKKYKARKFLAYFQSFTNTYAPLEHLKALYDEALSCEGVVGMAVGTRPDCVDQAKIDLLDAYTKDYLIWLEYGLQSVHDATLALINRGHDFKAFKAAVDLVAPKKKLNVCAHIILGLPGETRAMMLENAGILGDLGVDGVKIHLLYVVRGTALAKMYGQGRYTPLEQQAYVDLVCDFLERLPKSMIIQRITGDPHADELVAPLWAARYRETFNMIQHTLEARDSYQGKCGT
ncbi:TIGR01212 family radical SAM protein [Desulfobacter latus]|uniref:TIGR01212 family radical SAM protein n=1 Tax=Desulfobacter latus TaxID=2292 RepID=A0A850SXN2_9BACT|nr:TIGR01212 family radical SAM protein [Desulfobacter latus]NWH06084.1 TIGR01212 family radical SAM protein [Desulfobacter latus]